MTDVSDYISIRHRDKLEKSDHQACNELVYNYGCPNGNMNFRLKYGYSENGIVDPLRPMSDEP